ncbi:MAG: Fe-S cluster assembly protein SufD [Deltaproteobacteria bacterium RIFCSPLOWO2_02_FULL_46_8]|nr:MAG: Fe-S cluster assembly protein SufD [Deltaproteobacteria bacterium RIFCSPLOWO2_02_FULL_46_8]
MEPRWLQNRRSEAAKDFAMLPIPSKDEFWRRTDLKKVKMDRFTPLPASANGALEHAASKLLPVSISLSGEFLYGEKTSPVTLEKTWEEKGVILKPLNKALLENEDLVSKYLGRGLSGRNEKFLSQNDAFWQTGAFCYIPPNTTVELPLLMNGFYSSGGRAAFPKILIVLGQGAQATVIDLASSKTEEGENFLNGVTEVYLEENANLTWIDLQDLSVETSEVSLKRAELAGNAHLKWVTDVQGGKISKTNIETVLNGPGARAEVVGLFCGRGKQHLEICATTHHTAPYTTADILFKGTADDQSKIIFQGIIRIEKSAQQTESFMANHNMILNEQAHAESIPRLEILADEVKASHGATVGQVDKEKLFYLQSRGLTKEFAEQLLVDGFYEDIFGRIPLEPVRELMRKNMETRKYVL